MRHSVVAIGNFDGVHSGHQALLKRARERAEREGAEPLPVIVVTFWPHPLQVLAPDKAPKLLSSLDERIAWLRRAGADEVRVVQFTAEIADWSPQHFVDTIVAPLNPVAVVVGENFSYGKAAAGTARTLAEDARGRFEVDVVNLSTVDEDVSCSTLVRSILAQGDVEQAARHLDRHYSLSGVVVVGDQRGRLLGFPTANLVINDARAVPADGVYAGWLTVEGEGTTLPAAISVGTNPTFDGTQRRVESYVLDRTDLELYGKRITVDFIAGLRGQVRFNSTDELIEQMHADVARTREILGVEDPHST